MENTPDISVDNAVIPEVAAPLNADDNHKEQKINLRRKFVIYGSILALIGWLTLMLSPYISFGSALAGLVLSIIGVRIPAGPRRDLAITAIIASSVLLIVFALFTFLLYII